MSKIQHHEDCGECEAGILYTVDDIENKSLTCKECGSEQLPCNVCIIVNRLEHGIDVLCNNVDCAENQKRMISVLKDVELHPEKYANKSYGHSAT